MTYSMFADLHLPETMSFESTDSFDEELERKRQLETLARRKRMWKRGYLMMAAAQQAKSHMRTRVKSIFNELHRTKRRKTLKRSASSTITDARDHMDFYEFMAHKLFSASDRFSLACY